MREDWVPDSSEKYSEYLKELRAKREEEKARSPGRRRTALSPVERDQVLKKTGGRCHICGGNIDSSSWDADHVRPHAEGGQHSVDNYLPAHPTCNHYRWYYLSDEFQEILRTGVWLRTQIENQTPIGRDAGEAFVQYEKERIRRRR